MPGEALEQRDRAAADDLGDGVGQRRVVDRDGQVVGVRRSARRESSMSRSTTKRWPSSRSAAWTPWRPKASRPRIGRSAASPLTPPAACTAPRRAGRRPSRARRAPAAPPPRGRRRPARRRASRHALVHVAADQRAEHALARRRRSAPAAPARRAAGTPASSARLCSSVLPKPMPGSRTTRSSGTPASTAACSRSSRWSRTSATTSPYLGSPCIVRGSPRMWTRQTAAPRSATSGSRPGRARPAVTSLTSAAARVERRLGHRRRRGVDRDRRAAAAPRASRRAPPRAGGAARRRRTGSAPGRVLSAPTSQIAAPSSAIREEPPARPPAPIGPAPPQSESGVTLRIPMTQGGRSQASGSATRERLRRGHAVLRAAYWAWASRPGPPRRRSRRAPPTTAGSAPLAAPAHRLPDGRRRAYDRPGSARPSAGNRRGSVRPRDLPGTRGHGSAPGRWRRPRRRSRSRSASWAG